MKEKVKKILKNEFLLNILTVFSGNTISQILPLLFYPIITRIYEPSEFALISLFTATALIFGNISTMQYHKAIMVAEDDSEATNVLALSFICIIVVTTVTTIVIIVFNQFIVDLMANDYMSIWLYLVPLTVFFTGMTNTLNMWASRQKEFKRLAVEKVANKSSSSIGKIGIGYLQYTNAGLILGSLIGQFVSNLYLVVLTFKDQINFKTISVQKVKKLMYKYRHFPIYSNLSKSGGAIKETTVKYVISNFFGASILGAYSFTYGILMQPLSLIGNAVSHVYFQKISELFHQKKDIWPIQRKIILYLSLIGFIALLPVYFFGEELFRLIFGEKWVEAGTFASLMTPWLFAIFISSPLLSLNYVLNKQKQYMCISVGVNLLFPLVLIISSLLITNFNSVLIIISWAGFIINMFWIVWVRKYSLQYQADKSGISY